MSCSALPSRLECVLKCAVCMQLVDQPKILTCCHSLCSQCIAQLPRHVNEEKSGIYCPICNHFSEEENVRSSFLVNELLRRYIQSHDKNCQHCTENESKWNCVDCKMNLCNECRANHLKIPTCRNHQLVEGKAEVEMVVDAQIYCTSHPNELVKFSCEDCDVPVCITCKVTKHENHKIETIEEALQRILPEVKANKEELEKIIATLDNKHEELTSKIDKVTEEYRRRKDEADRNLNEVIAKAKEEYDEIMKQLDIKQKEAVTKLESSRPARRL